MLQKRNGHACSTWIYIFTYRSFFEAHDKPTGETLKAIFTKCINTIIIRSQSNDQANNGEAVTTVRNEFVAIMSSLKSEKQPQKLENEIFLYKGGVPPASEKCIKTEHWRSCLSKYGVMESPDAKTQLVLSWPSLPLLNVNLWFTIDRLHNNFN